MDLNPGLRWPWLAVVLAVLVVAALVVWSCWRGRSRTPREAMLVAHSERIRGLARFRTLARQQSWLATWQTVAVLVAAAGAILLAARPQATAVTERSLANRDVVLCLDASTSMFDEDVQVLDAFGQIVDGLRGERVSLVLWSDAAVTVFPLTDDYAFVKRQLAEASDAFARQDFDYLAGTFLGRRASIITDGIVSCTQRFDHADQKRGRAVIVASDNDPQGGAPIFTWPEVSAYARDHDVRLYGIGSLDLAPGGSRRDEFANAMTSTGGTFALLGEDGSVDRIVTSIEQLEAARVRQPPEITVDERPGAAIAVTGLGVLMLLGGWGVALARRLGGGAA
ncbi:VWA domain-containing protein [Nocardioides sp. DS6]|uniref:VWA domain-containing protein n=1 Tax=Nocardioides eburneus TaxID=3231482 RepID=A0ABV3SX11_9ACTN